MYKYLGLSFSDQLKGLSILLFPVMLGLFYSCANKSEKLRNEVTAYFKSQKNAEKLRAACYLLDNMGGRHSLSGANYEKYEKIYSEIGLLPLEERSAKINSLLQEYSVSNEFEVKNDYDYLSSQYIIDHVEAAWKIWEKTPWKKDYPFEMFCEYVLPYRIQNEAYSQWITDFNIRFSTYFDEIYFFGGARHKAIDCEHDINDLLKLPDVDTSTLVRLTPGKRGLLYENLYMHNEGEKYLQLQYTGSMDSAIVQFVINSKDTIVKILHPTASFYSYPTRPVRFEVALNRGANSIELRAVKGIVAINYIELIAKEPFYRNDENYDLLDGNTYIFSNISNGRCLEIDERSVKNRSLLRHGIYSGKRSQQFNIQNIDYGFFRICPADNGSFARSLDVDGYSYENYDTLVQWDTHGSYNQQWAIVPVGRNIYKIVSKLNSKCMSLSNFGNLVVQDDYKGLPTQHWKLDRADSTIYFDTLFHVPQNTPLEYACRVKDALAFNWLLLNENFPPQVAKNILQYHSGGCREESNYLLYVLRSLGIPAVIDFNPQRPHAGLGHDWNAIIDQRHKTIYYQAGAKPGVGRPQTPVAKIYRKTFKANLFSLYFLKEASEYIPSLFENPYMQDVTSEYFNTAVVNINLFQTQNIVEKKHAYLCVWNNQNWVPVAWAAIKDGAAMFSNMGVNVAYLPVVYDNKSELIPAAYPFVLTESGRIKRQLFNKQTLRSVVLKRKFPWFDHNHFLNGRYNGGVFQGANQSDFSDATPLFTIKGDLEPVPFAIDVKCQRTFKYVRYLSPDYSFASIAELQFFDNKGAELEGEVIGSEGSFRNMGDTKEKAFDKNILTHFSGLSTTGVWLGLELYQPESIGKIKFYPRSDGNCVEIGDEYDLMFWNNKSWQSLGAVKAAEDSLVYSNCPKDALFLLRNRTKGREERIFTIDENGKQVWW